MHGVRARVGPADYAYFGKAYGAYYDPASMMNCKSCKSNGPHVLGYTTDIGGTGFACMARTPVQQQTFGWICTRDPQALSETLGSVCNAQAMWMS